MTKLYTFNGQAPTEGYPPAGMNTDKVLDLMLAQMEVLKQMTLRVMFVPAGTKIEENDLGGQRDVVLPAKEGVRPIKGYIRWQCVNGHLFQVLIELPRKDIKCPECGWGPE